MLNHKADQRVAQALDYQPNQPILLIEQTGYNSEERPVFLPRNIIGRVLFISVYLAGLVRCAAIWEETS